MEMNLNFKIADQQDLEVLLDLSLKTFYPAFAPLNTEENMRHYMEEAFSREQLKTELANDKSIFYLLEVDNSYVGYLKLNFAPAQTDLNDPTSLEIQRIYVLPGFQGLKLGEKMIQKAVAVAKEKQLQYLWLGVWEKNTRAIRFYQQHGFSIVGKHPFPFGDEIQTDLIMKRAI